jgi:UDP-N-acetylmuramyl pentapeptide phosphotransferase/UDP-N-acetylglucosamine-1-phosphate transferase
LPAITHLDTGQLVLTAAVIAGTGLVSGLLTRLLIPLLRRHKLLDHPNERSSHVVPTPRGGGMAPVGTILAAWTLLALGGWVRLLVVVVVLAAVVLALVSWLDDLRDLSPATRLAAQAAAVAIGLCAVPRNPLSPWLGPAAAFAGLGLVWIWWVNLFNFMDGIDGLASSEAAAIGSGLLAVTGLGIGIDPAAALLAGALLGAALGFLIWNWAPARVFLGDVGSAALGYLTGFLLITVASRGHWITALVLPLYFLADATITLVWRLLRGEKVLRAHRQHFYQQAVRGGLGHAAVVWRIIAADVALIGCAWAAANGSSLTASAVAAATVAALLAALASAR